MDQESTMPELESKTPPREEDGPDVLPVMYPARRGYLSCELKAGGKIRKVTFIEGTTFPAPWDVDGVPTPPGF